MARNGVLSIAERSRTPQDRGSIENLVGWVKGSFFQQVSGQIRRQPPGAKPDQVPLHVAVKAGGTPYTFDGQGVCRRAEKASIYDAPASMWSVQQDGEERNLTLTVWRLQGGKT